MYLSNVSIVELVNLGEPYGTLKSRLIVKRTVSNPNYLTDKHVPQFISMVYPQKKSNPVPVLDWIMTTNYSKPGLEAGSSSLVPHKLFSDKT